METPISKRYSVFSLLSICILCTPLSMLLGFVYNFFLQAIPIVYINVLFTFLIGFPIGHLVYWLSLWTKISDKKAIMVTGALVGCITFVFQWLALLSFLQTDSLQFSSLWKSLEDPLFWSEIPSYIQFIYNNGYFTIADMSIDTTALGLIWMAEFLLFVGLPVWVIAKKQLPPYSEMLSKFYSCYLLKDTFGSMTGSESFKEKFKAAPLETIISLGYGRAERYTAIKVFFLESETVQYLRFERKYLSSDKKSQMKTEIIIDLLPTEYANAAQILKEFDHEKLSFFEL